MDRKTSLPPIRLATGRTILINNKPVNENSVSLEDAAIVIANFRSLIFAIFSKETEGGLKLEDVRDYNVSFFNSPGDNRTQIIFKDALFTESLEARKMLAQFGADLDRREKNIARDGQQLQALETRDGEEFHSDSRAILNSKISAFKKDKKRYHEQLPLNQQALQCDALQLEGASARYGTNTIIPSHNADGLESDVVIFEPLDQRGGHNPRDLNDAETKKRVFKALLDLEDLSQELMARPAESAIMKAVVRAQENQQSPVASAAKSLPIPNPAAKKISLFASPSDFAIEMHSLPSEEKRPAIDDAHDMRTRQLPPLMQRPSTARFEGATSRAPLPTIPVAASSTSTIGDRPPLQITGSMMQDLEDDESASESESDQEEAAESASHTASQDLVVPAATEEAQEDIEETPAKITSEEAEILDETDFEKFTVVAPPSIRSETTKPLPSKFSGALLTEQQRAAVQKEMQDITRRFFESTKAKKPAAAQAAKAPKKESGINAESLTSDHIWNFAKYIYTSYLDAGKKSTTNSKGYCGVMNRGTSRAANLEDIKIILKTSKNPLILHCTRSSLKIFRANTTSKTIVEVASFDQNQKEQFCDVINSISAIKGLSDAKRDSVLRGEIKAEMKPKPAAQFRAPASLPTVRPKTVAARPGTSTAGKLSADAAKKGKTGDRL